MKRALLASACLMLALPACSQKAEEAAASREMMAVDAGGGATVMAVQEAPADAATGTAPEPITPANAVPVGQPKIAYVYNYGYRIAAGAIHVLQRRHADLCERQGPMVCRIIDMRQDGGEGAYATGSLALAVAAPRARAFGVELAKAADAAGGTEISSAISGEDLSKQIVDTEARLRARTLLRDRLMEVLATRKGTVAELVEAERGVAQVNEEIDQARGWLEEMKGRVDFSRINIDYQSGSPSGGGFMGPVREAVGSIGTILGMVVAALILGLTVLVPLGLVAFGLIRLRRALRARNVNAAPTDGDATG